VLPSLPFHRRLPLSQTAKQRKAAEEEARRLGIAPSSLYEGDNLPAIAAVEYIYRPKMKELLAFELPSNLALPAIADIALQVRVCAAPSVLPHARMQYAGHPSACTHYAGHPSRAPACARSTDTHVSTAAVCSAPLCVVCLSVRPSPAG
jgi:hypothetical protein